MELHTQIDLNSNIALPRNIQSTAPAPSQTPGGKNPPSVLHDKVILSQEGKDKASQAESSAKDKTGQHNNPSGSSNQYERAQLQQLKQRDIEVRTHEQAHLSAAGQYARGGASFTYKKGADGKSYAVGGEVGIDTAKESSPEATISKMQTIKRAALAPASPSGADRRIAAQATIKESQARKELLQEQQENLLHEESATHPLSKPQGSNQPIDVDGVSPSHGMLRTMLETYSNMAVA